MQLKSHAVKKKKKQWLLQRVFQAEATVKPTPTCSTNTSVLDYSCDLEIMCLCGALSQLLPQGPLGGIPMSSATHWSNAPGNMLVKLYGMHLGSVPENKDKSNSEMPTVCFFIP